MRLNQQIITELAQEVLEDTSSVSAWLNKENRALGGVCPISLLDTNDGFILVKDVLLQIQYGVVA